MATLRPFQALRPRPELASRVCELPYDVMSTAEARELAGDNPLSFLRVSRPELELPPATDPYSRRSINAAATISASSSPTARSSRDARPCFYLYRQVMGAHSQTGLVAAASCQEYLDGIVKKHELTRPDKEDDRVRHIETLDAQTGPVFLTYRASAGARSVYRAHHRCRACSGLHRAGRSAPLGVGRGCAGGPRVHRAEFARVPFSTSPMATIAAPRRDGCIRRARAGAAADVFLTVTFPHNQMQVLPYNRVLKDLNGLTPAQLLAKLDAVFVISANGSPQPARKPHARVVPRGRLAFAHLPSPVRCTTDPSRVSMSRCSRNTCSTRCSASTTRAPAKSIDFIGGIRVAPAELEKLVRMPATIRLSPSACSPSRAWSSS